jgi:hypothetical protein
LTTRIDSSPSCTTETISAWCLRTSCVAFFTARLKRATKSKRNGVAAMAISAKSHSSQNMMPSMPTIVMRSTRIPSVPDEAKPWMVFTSEVIVERIAPVWCVS